MAVGKALLKYLLFIFNFLFWLSGLAILVAGAVIQIRYSTYVSFLGGGVVSIAVVLIILGAVIGIIGFFGCCGAIRENHCLIMTFVALLVVVFIVEFGAMIAAYVLRKDLTARVGREMKEGLNGFGQEGYTGLTEGWNKIQEQFKCCGVNAYNDWNATEAFVEHEVPDSCCKDIKQGCGKDAYDPSGPKEKIYSKGCLESFLAWAKNNIAIIGGIAAGVAVLQVLGIILACCYGRSIREGYKSV